MKFKAKKIFNVFMVFALFFSFLSATAFSQKKQQKVYTVKGLGSPPKNVLSEAQKNALACRAAQVDGYRNLAEIVKGVQVDSQTTVENFELVSDEIKTKVQAVIQGAQVIDKKMLSDGTCEVTMQLGIEQILEVMPPPTNYVPPTQEVKEEKPKTNTSKNKTEFAVSIHIKRGNWDPTANNYNNEGLDYLQKKDYANAIAKFKLALNIDPNFDIAVGNIGVAYAFSGDAESAIKYYKKAIEIDPKWSDHHVNLGYGYLALNDYSSATAEAKKALELNSQNEWAYALIGKIKYLQGQYAEAAKSYAKAVTLTYENDPSLPRYYYYAGYSYYMAKDNANAKVNLKAALKYKSDYWEAKELLDKL